MVKKLIAVFVGVLLCMSEVCLAKNTSLGLPYSHDLETIVDRGELRVAIYPDSALAPFVVDNGRQLGGYDVDLAQAIAQHLGVNLHIDQASSYNEAVAFVANGRDDIAVSNLTATPERALSVFFTAPYYSVPLALIAKNDFNTSNFNLSGGVISFDSSLNIAVEANSANSYYASLAFPNATISTYTNLSQAVQAVSTDKYDAVFIDNLAAQNAAAGEVALQVFVLGKAYVDPQTIAVNSNMPQLLLWINNYLASLRGQIEQATLKRNYKLT